MQALVKIGPSNASQGGHRRKKTTEQMKKSDTRSDLNQGPRLVTPMLYRLSYGVCKQIPNFNPYELSNLQFIPPHSFHHVDIYIYDSVDRWSSCGGGNFT